MKDYEKEIVDDKLTQADLIKLMLTSIITK